MKRWTRYATTTAAVLVVLASAGCGGGDKKVADKSLSLLSASPSARASATASPSSSSQPGSRKGGTSTAGGAKPVSPPPTPKLPWPEDEFLLEAHVEPACIVPGTKATLVVDTLSKSAIAYEAIYSDRNSGSAPPWGKGYGGNDKGYADTVGHFTSTWTVAPTAPAGPGRVNVIVITQQGQRGYRGPIFNIAKAGGGC